jgi:ABC-type nitrate/sulfonate/bicarbonate transport system ATPase subunit
VSEAVALADRVVVLSANPGTIRAEHAIGVPRPRPRAHADCIRLEAAIQAALG